MSASGVAAAINPNGPEGQQIHLFYNTNTKNLGFQFFDETKHTDETEAFAAGADGQTGFIINPAQVATTNLTGVELVVGFTNKLPAAAANDCKCDDPTQNDVSIISPVYQPLAATDLTNLTIAAVSSDTTAYVYYLTGTDYKSTTINELTVGDDSPGQFDDTVKILAQSSLAAFYVPEDEKRYIIYQAYSTKRLHAYCPIAGSIDDKEIDNSGDARPNTPLAAAYVNGKAYVYYVDTTQSIRVVVRDDTVTSPAWSSSRAVQAPSQVDDASQITVVPSPKGNHIFYVGVGQGKQFKFHHAIDKI
ncbi:hypothetical protein CHGG_00066 [Chaetomium globosum CBS 148.51]|uniref:Fucose-specific lectin n=1 Tax=Chaetomium globosum (strain ATCC 6205 / CBS 148.51 / DSM 1962 / NBRC 6347 / NRRL 1970) TaxID=306901 RepID=Q2HI88_CHAGB|nr:uncharacterized protein CHGG_00066 [Chaetomium globosum CBS 148.51]EAQ91831.1 hypothetical protein CHGG_00066 [Chaetomium globosum CBS 148.51]